MTAQPESLDLPDGFDPTDPELNEVGIPHAEFLALRKHAPVFWIEQPPESRAGMEGGTGYWAVSRHEDVALVSKSKDFVTSENTAIIRLNSEITREEVELQRVMLINQDPPDHTKSRQVISRGFTPRAIGALHGTLQEWAEKIVDDAIAKGSGDFVTDIASELPLQAIAELLGVPQEDRRKLFDWSNQMLAYDDPDYDVDPAIAAAEILGYAMGMAEDRRANPRDDIITKLVTADVDGHGQLNDDEFGYFVILLAVAGNETTRNAITHGMKAFFDHPDQWELFRSERPRTTVDEIIRWATPVTVFQRTATVDTEVGGQKIEAGQRVGIFYASANHDDEVFADPGTFDITRDPNPHVAFGGHGAHYCIGANLARLEVEIMFNVIADRLPDIAASGPERRLRSGWINGIKELPVRYSV